MNESDWSKNEKKIARNAFNLAYRRECEEIAAKLTEKVVTIKEPADIWRIHDYLTDQRDDISEKYDYRYSVLIFLFARLIREGRLKESDLAGIDEKKIAQIKLLVDQ
jgi:hypothetical protein